MNAVLAATLSMILSAADGNDGVIRIDFGTPTSPVRKGYLRVTHETKWSKDTPAGWVDTNGLWSKDWPVSREWTYSESRGRKYPPPVYMTDLRRDHVGGTRDATLRIRAASGAYRVWVLVGTAGGRREQVWDIDVFEGNGNRGARARFAGPHEARTLRLLAEAAKGWLDLDLFTESRWNVCALIAVPIEDAAKSHAEEIAEIEREVFLLPEDVRKDWRHTPHQEPAPRPQPTAAERKRGFILYHRSYLWPVWPNTSPRREECEPTLRAFASPDEYEPLTFTVLPLVDGIGDMVVRVEPLTAGPGRVIDPEEIDLRYVRYMHVRPNYSSHGTYYRAPDVLMPLPGPVPLREGENLRVWLTVRVGVHAAPGIYRGHVGVTSRSRDAAAAVPIVFRVLPIKLQKDQTLVYGTYYYHPYDMAQRAPDAFSRRWWQRKAELEHADMAAHGLNAFVSGIGGKMDKSGRWVMDFDALGAKIDLARRHGFDKPIICHIPTSVAWRKYMKGEMGSHLRLVKELPPGGFFDDVTAMVRAIEAGRRRRQWPELLYYPIDEPGTGEPSIRFMVEVLKAIKKVPGVRTYVTADPAHEAFAPMKPHVDVWCCQPFSLPRETILADMKQRGVEYWCYPNHIAGENDHTPVAGARMTYGFGFWRSGFRALTPWIYQAVVSDPWNYLDGGSMDFFNRTADDASPIPCTLWEAYREGIDDGRYVTTLTRRIDRAREMGLAKEADEAAAGLKFVWDSIDVQEKYKYDGLWEPETFDVYRWIIARQILKLQEAAGKR
jgi:hypothetical protein